MKTPKPSETIKLLHVIADQVQQSANAIYKLDKKLDLHIQKTDLSFDRIHELDQVQNKLLDEHIAGVNSLRKLLDSHEEDNRKQFEKLEAPQKWVIMSAKVIATGTVGIATLLAALNKLFHWF